MAYNDRDNKTRRDIFVCGGLNSALSSGQVKFPEGSTIQEAVELLQDIWTVTLGSDVLLESAIEALPKKDADSIYKKLQAEIDEARSYQQVSIWWDRNARRILTLPEDWRGYLRTRAQEKMLDLRNQQELAKNAV